MDNRNYILAIALSFIVLVAWQYFFIAPRIEAEREKARVESQTKPESNTLAPTPGADIEEATTAESPGAGGAAAPAADRETVIARTARVPVETPSISGSISLVGARIDDLRLNRYRETIKPGSSNITLFSPSGAPHAYYSEFGWVPPAGLKPALPTSETEWTLAEGTKLTPGNPVTLEWDNGEGLVFRRVIEIDENYMFTVKQSVENTTGDPVTLYPYGLVSRHETPETTNFYILHEGLIGVLGEDGLQEVDYDDVKENRKIEHRDVNSGWLGITDKYWAAAIIPDGGPFRGEFRYEQTGGRDNFVAAFLGDAKAIAAGATVETRALLFAGAKETPLIDAYEAQYGINQFELMIDWGWFYFLTKPMFKLIDWLYKLVGNFGIAILLVTVIIKLVFFPLANKSYVSMSRMKLVQPQMKEIQERHKDDRAAQQKAMMELYKKEKINPLSGCLPIVVQIPVFFALYKVLFVTIEMRHAPFFGWIQDLAAPDPTTLFNLFGLLPFDVPAIIPAIGVWPVLMGITMFLQMKLNPAPQDPVQQMVFTWMPVFFTFLLASFPAGLVIYWTWNNLLSIIQQYTIMRRQGAKVELWDNITGMFKKSKKEPAE